jgi:hypothetical protein
MPCGYPIAIPGYVYMFALIFTTLVNTEEMDWDKNGTVTFKEFLFAFTRWVGIDNEDDDDEDKEE